MIDLISVGWRPPIYTRPGEVDIQLGVWDVKDPPPGKVLAPRLRHDLLCRSFDKRGNLRAFQIYYDIIGRWPLRYPKAPWDHLEG